jgi:hypothetical protein
MFCRKLFYDMVFPNDLAYNHSGKLTPASLKELKKLLVREDLTRILAHLAAPPFGFIDLFFVREIWRQRRNQPIRQLCPILVWKA